MIEKGDCEYCTDKAPLFVQPPEAPTKVYLCARCLKLIRNPSTGLALIRGNLTMKLRGRVAPNKLKPLVDKYIEELTQLSAKNLTRMTPAEYQKKMRAERLGNSLCTSCGGPGREGKSVCESCQQKKSSSVKKWRESHRKTSASLNRKSYEEKSSRELCTKCGGVRDGTQKMCGRCREKARVLRKARYAKSLAEARCGSCSAPSTVGALCAPCKIRAKNKSASPEVAARSREKREENWQSVLLSNLKIRAEKKKIPIDDLSWEDIPDPRNSMCPVFGVPYEVGHGSKKDFSATVDRKIPSLGYVRGNLQLLSSLANDIKSDAGPEMLFLVASALKQMEENHTEVNDLDENTRSRRQKMVSQKRSSNKTSRNLEFSLEWFHFSLPELCPCTGMKITYQDSSNWKSRPSIDRVDNSRGYVPGNVWVISAWANAIKSSANSEQIQKVAEWLANQEKPNSS